MQINPYMNQIQNAYTTGTVRNVSPVKPAVENENAAIKGSSSEAFAIKDTYEPAKDQVKVNFGGYDQNGRGGISKLGGVSAGMPVQNDFSTKDNGSSGSYIMDGLSSVLNQSTEDTKVTMKEAGLEVEDLVYPDRAKSLSQDPSTQAALEDFATNERSSLLAESGMTGEELDQFVNAVKPQP